jgi:hypothetical protein
MIEVGRVILSDDIKDEFFVCDLEKCKGACCVEGHLGAPLTEEELTILDQVYPAVAPYLMAAGRASIESQGKYILDDEGDYSTTTIGGKECAYAVYDDRGVLKCGIEQAHNDGKIDFKKPISCHLYPIRISSYEKFDAVNYDRWHICHAACTLGKSLGVPVYQFLKEPLVRKYGLEWYEKLEAMIQDLASLH